MSHKGRDKYLEQQQELEEEIAARKEEFENCDCKGSASLPWEFCDSCTEYQEMIDKLMQPEESEASKAGFDAYDMLGDSSKDYQ